MNLSIRQPQCHTICVRAHLASNDLTRRRLIAGGIGALALGAAGCSIVDNDDSAGSQARTVEHAYGTTQLPDDPKRVVALGYTDVEVVLSMGVVPVGFTDFFGTGLNEWARPLAGETTPDSWELTDGVPLEKIIALEPDLVIASDALNRNDYDRLHAAVPTVGPFEKNAAFGTPWRDHTRRTAKALNRVELGEKVISDMEDKYADVQEVHPSFLGSTVTYAWPIEPDYYVYGASDPRVQVFLELGFELTDAIKKLDTEESKGSEAGIALSAERLDLLDADLIVAQDYGTERHDIERRHLLDNIPAVDNGNLLWLPERVSDGLAFGTALSTMAILDDLVDAIVKTTQ